MKKFAGEGPNCVKSGAKSGSGFRTFLGPLSFGTLSTGSKKRFHFRARMVPPPFTLELAWSRKIWAETSARCSPFLSVWQPTLLVQLQPKSRFADTFSRFFGLVNETAKPSKIADHSSRRLQQGCIVLQLLFVRKS